jgi:4-diphosphocytidyl-2-C-methyl-D-erythritol kinase
MPTSPEPNQAGGRYEEGAPAKVNLFLHVLGRRDDGLHRLESLVVFADVGDRLELDVTPASDAVHECESVVITGPFAAALHQDLGAGGRLTVEVASEVARTAALPRRFGVDLTLVKNLPVAAGLGGGSADGAAALRALSRAFGLGWSEEKLAAEALAIGADGPVCARSVPTLMRGIGEILRPLAAWPDFDVVIVNSGAPVSTRAVFEAFDARGGGSPPPAAPPATRDREAALAYLSNTNNDLFAAAAAVEPTVGLAYGLLQRQRGARVVRLSGSGGSCWAIFDVAEDAARAAAEVSRSKPGWWVAATRLRGIG